MRLFWIFLALAVLMLLPFVLWADALQLSQAEAVVWLRRFGGWAWLAGVVLLVSDLVLPVPGTAVMAALGLIYGAPLGGLIGAAGSFLAGATAFGLCRLVGRPAAVWLVGEVDLRRGEALFTDIGGWLVAVSRWLPLFPEVIACMAGLVRMPRRLFFFALACGSIPLAFVYAAIGAAGFERPALALGLSAGLPPLLWLIIQHWIRRRAAGVKLDSKA
jgi:uncharacterized membrane protein YdjX (TVP38/TMEM64 family)